MSDTKSSLALLALGWITSLPDAAKLVTVVGSLLAVGFGAGTVGSATVFTKQVDEVKLTQAQLSALQTTLTADVRALERRVLRSEAADSVRFIKLVCLMTDARELTGLSASRMCGL